MRQKHLYSLWVLLYLVATGPFFVFARDIESVSHESDRISQEAIENKLRVIPKQLPKPEPKEIEVPAEEKKYLINKIVLDGCETFTPESFSEITSEYSGKELSFTEIELVAQRIQREYLRRGIIAAVVVPAQEIKEGVVTLKVVEAKMGQLQIQEGKYFNSERLVYYWETAPGSVMKYDFISRNIQEMNKNPDREVRAALRAGKRAGTTDVILTPKERFPMHVTAGFDNDGIMTTGKKRSSVGYKHNNFLGLDDTLLFGYNFGYSFTGKYVYHSLPIGYNGASVIYGYSRSRSSPKKEYATDGINSRAENSSLTLHQDIYYKDEYLADIFGGFSAKDKTVTTKDGTLNRDRLRIFNLGASFVFRGAESSTTISPEISRGTKWFGASKRNNPLSSRKAKSEFTKVKLNLEHRRSLPHSLQANFKFRSQLASAKLTPQEEMDLGGIDSVRGYPPSDYSADCAGIVNAELLIPGFFIPARIKIPFAKGPFKDDVTMVAFCDYAHGMRREALPTEKRSVNKLSLGGGMRVRLFDQALFRMEWGFPIGANNPQTESGNSRFHFSVDFQDKFPEEIERMLKARQDERIKEIASRIVDEEFDKSGSLQQSLAGLLEQGKDKYAQGSFEESRACYDKVLQISSSLYEQAEDYVRLCLNQEKTLKQKMRSAENFYEAGEPAKAKAVWEEVVRESEAKPLSLKY